jgi:hypothetical protein
MTKPAKESCIFSSCLVTHAFSLFFTHVSFILIWRLLKTKNVYEVLSNSSWQQTVSKERPGSIVTKTPKKRIFMPIGMSNKSDFYADFKYISLIKFSLTH